MNSRPLGCDPLSAHRFADRCWTRSEGVRAGGEAKPLPVPMKTFTPGSLPPRREQSLDQNPAPQHTHTCTRTHTCTHTPCRPQVQVLPLEEQVTLRGMDGDSRCGPKGSHHPGLLEAPPEGPCDRTAAECPGAETRATCVCVMSTEKGGAGGRADAAVTPRVACGWLRGRVDTVS